MSVTQILKLEPYIELTDDEHAAIMDALDRLDFSLRAKGLHYSLTLNIRDRDEKPEEDEA